MSTGPGPGRDNTEDETDVVDIDAATAEPATEIFAPADPTEMFAPVEEPAEDQRRFTAPSAFDSSTQIIGAAPADPATEILDLPGAEEPAAPRTAGPQAIPARGEVPAVPSPRRRSWGWVIALVLVIAALVAVAVLVTVLLTRGGSPSDQVRSAIESYTTAVQNGDLATLRSITCGDYDAFEDQQWQELHAKMVANKEVPVMSSIDAVVVDGDRAEANVTTYRPADPGALSTRSFDLRRVGDTWKVCEGTE